MAFSHGESSNSATALPDVPGHGSVVLLVCLRPAWLGGWLLLHNLAPFRPPQACRFLYQREPFDAPHLYICFTAHLSLPL